MPPSRLHSRRRGAAVEWLGVAVAIILVIAFGVGLVGDFARTSLDTQVNGDNGILGRQAAQAAGNPSPAPVP